MVGSQGPEDQGGETQQFWNFKTFIEQHGKHPMAYIRELEGFREGNEKLLLLLAKLGDELTHQRGMTDWFRQQKQSAEEKATQGKPQLDAAIELYDGVIKAARDDFTMRSKEIERARERDKEFIKDLEGKCASSRQDIARLVLGTLRAVYDCYQAVRIPEAGDIAGRVGDLFSDPAAEHRLMQQIEAEIREKYARAARPSPLGTLFKKPVQASQKSEEEISKEIATEQLKKVRENRARIGSGILNLTEAVSKGAAIDDATVEKIVQNAPQLYASLRGGITDLGAKIQEFRGKYILLMKALGYSDSVIISRRQERWSEEQALALLLKEEREANDFLAKDKDRQLGELTQANDALVQEKDAAAQRYGALETTCDSIVKSNNKLSAEIKRLQGLLAAVEQERDKYKGEKDEAEVKRNIYRNSASHREQERREYDAHRQRYENLLTANGREIADLQEKLKKSQANADGYQDLVKHLQKQVENAEHERAGANVAKDHLERDFADYKRNEEERRKVMEGKHRQELDKAAQEKEALARSGQAISEWALAKTEESRRTYESQLARAAAEIAQYKSALEDLRKIILDRLGKEGV